jgi:hypothetical protein
MGPGTTSWKALLGLVCACLAACVDLDRPGQGSASTSDAGFEAGGGGGRGGSGGGAINDGGPTGGSPDVGPAGGTGAGGRGGNAGSGMAGGGGTPVDAPVDAPVDVAMMADLGTPMDNRGPGLAPGAACQAGAACADGNCVDGICCTTACTDACHACNVGGHAGTCWPEPANTLCAPASCSNGTAQAESRCNAQAQCLPASISACGAYACYMNFCGSACVTSADCASPFTCSGTTCSSPGLLLYWAFDEESGTTALDSSGNGRTGTMVGNGPSRPQPSTIVPSLKFNNPRSRDFVGSQDEGVIASPVPTQIKVSFEVTLAAWVRVTDLDVDGSDIVTFGADYMLRIEASRVQMIKHRSTQSGALYASATGTTTIPLDGNWHHLAGTSGAAGMRVYLDGIEVGFAGSTEPPIFSGPDQIGVGHQPGNDVHELTGQIDDVRIYGRVLGGGEIANLARGNR